MRIQQDKITITASDPLETQSFGIREKDMGFVLDILRKHMYADPIKAICREIACNARDANVEVGMADLPIEIVLPSSANKFIQFRDQGPGISPRRMGEIFLNYGASTKRSDNKLIGGYGIGCKSPFAYSDTFSVITVYGGKKRHYNAVIDESRAGCMNLLAEEDTDEHTGTTIIVPVHDKDIAAFARAVVDSTKFWRVRPNVVGLPLSVQYPVIPTPLLTGDDWALFNIKQLYNYHDRADQSVILIEGIPYSVTPSDLTVNSADDNHTHKWVHALLQNQLHLHFGVGKLTLASSRDTLHFDDKTRSAVLRKLENVRVALLKNAQAKIDLQPNLLEAERFWAKFTAQLPLAKEKEVSWKGFGLLGLVRTQSSGYDGSPLDKINIRRFHKKHASRANKYFVVSDLSSEVSLQENCAIFLMDDRDLSDGQIAKRMKAFLHNNTNIVNVYLIDWELDRATRIRWKEELGFEHIPVAGISSLADLKGDYQRRGRGPARTVIDAWKYDVNFYGEKSSERNWRPTKINKEDGEGVYIVCVDKRGQGYTDGKNGVLMSIINAAATAQLTDDEFYLIREQDTKKLGDDWVTFGEWMEEYVKPVCESVCEDELEYFKTANDKVINNSYLSHYKASNIRKRLPALFENYFESEKELEREFKNNQKNNQKKHNLYNTLKYKYPSTLKKQMGQHPIIALIDQINETYPLVKKIGRVYSEDTEHILDYINLIDARQKLLDESPKTAYKSDLGDEENYAAAC